jgi:hypothetical protein
MAEAIILAPNVCVLNLFFSREAGDVTISLFEIRFIELAVSSPGTRQWRFY